MAQSYCALPCVRAEIRNRRAQIPPRNPRTPPQSRGEIKTGKQTAHTDRKIQVGCGAPRRYSAIIDRFLYTLIVRRPSPNWVRGSGFFFEKIKKGSLKTLCTFLGLGALANAHCGKGAICCRTWPDHLFIWPFQKWVENHAPQFR